LAPEVQAGRVDVLKSFLYQMNDVFRRLLLFPMPTIAAINGHAFAGGAITSCCYDFRFMRSDRGYFCFPEVDIHIPFLPGMIAICRKAIPAALFEELYYTGKRAVAEELQRHHVIREAAPTEALMEEVMAFAGPLKKDRTTYGVMKQRLNAPIVKVLDELDPPVIETGRFLAE
jgi:enoyl-CoA hydratase/carnithine racemase